MLHFEFFGFLVGFLVFSFCFAVLKLTLLFAIFVFLCVCVCVCVCLRGFCVFVVFLFFFCCFFPAAFLFYSFSRFSVFPSFSRVLCPWSLSSFFN